VLRAQGGDFAGDGPDHQDAFLDGAGHVVVVRMGVQGGFGDDLPCQFHKDNYTRPAAGKQGDI